MIRISNEVAILGKYLLNARTGEMFELEDEVYSLAQRGLVRLGLDIKDNKLEAVITPQAQMSFFDSNCRREVGSIFMGSWGVIKEGSEGELGGVSCAGWLLRLSRFLFLLRVSGEGDMLCQILLWITVVAR